jgi:hypothetical protein
VSLQTAIDAAISDDAIADYARIDPVTGLCVFTVGTLAPGIDAARTAEANRTSPPVTTPIQVEWPAPAWDPWATPLSTNLTAVHDAFVAVEDALRAFAPVESAGAGVVAAIDTRAGVARATLEGTFGTTNFATLGVDPAAAPERGLLAWPTLDTASAQALATEVATWYDAASNDTAITTEDKDNRRLIRPRFDHRHLYAVWVWARVKDATDPCAADQIVWSRRSEVYSLAETSDILGAKPVAFSLPDIPKLLKDVPRIPLAGANPFAALTLPPGSSVSTGENMKDTAQKWGVAWICSFGIPVFTICAWILFSVIFSILILIGFAWMLLLKFCIPVPAPKS